MSRARSAISGVRTTGSSGRGPASTGGWLQLQFTASQHLMGVSFGLLHCCGVLCSPTWRPPFTRGLHHLQQLASSPGAHHSITTLLIANSNPTAIAPCQLGTCGLHCSAGPHGALHCCRYSLRLPYGLTMLPEGVGQLSALHKLDLGGCSGLTALPDGVGHLSALQTLDLVGCSGLTALPDALGQLSALQTLDLAGAFG
jgi:Leucine-rich repeat (LRR) protein